MSRTTAFFWPLALAICAALPPSTGCITPAVVSGVDPDVCHIIAPGVTERDSVDPAPVERATVEAVDVEAVPFESAPDELKSLAEPRELTSVERISMESNGPSRLTPSLIADPIPAVELLPPAERARLAGHTLPPRVSLSQAETTTPGEPTAELPTALRIKPLHEISLDIAPPTLLSDQQQPIAPPIDYAAEALPRIAAEQPFLRGDVAAAGFDWHPAPEGLNFGYQPLYFEEVNAERYGHSFGILQPAISAVAFYGRIPFLPYMTFARPARRCTFDAHWALPGYKIPRWEPQPIVPSVSGAGVEIAALYGLILLIP